ncbi:aminotransferase class V-fold PLP-dependent enzyme [Atopomonas sediminilitoris]|uniref:aminotransferase class V-fold PLP-dependent enzyme n=1 Tax=Atopomonas sediminilitoris TaxID=2919919 RepID=UPI001F4EBE39|nr:aminotransferase class V-fold PLP-dependent enzyme [Atopomonas sediminilitoris]MCJ8167742.1 aminotransferase class V-fold PLP-dependent enzyme [Atopomonas sediminilitoris]
MGHFENEFPQDDHISYLNHAAVAPWPRRSQQAVSHFAQENCQQGATHYPSWLKVESRLRERLTRLLNAPSSDDIALVKNTSEALSFVAFGLDWRAGDEVVISDQEFPSNRIVWEALAPLGVQVKIVSLNHSNPEAALLAACTPRTRLMAISAVQYASGLRLDLATLGQGCRQAGVLLCVDAIQQLGAQPMDVQSCHIDFAMADGHKWLLGPEGLGVFYCRSALREQLKLHEYGWHMVEHVGDYNRPDWQPAASARRFECGSPNMLGAYALEASLSLLEEVSMPTVAALIDQKVSFLLEGLTRRGDCQILSASTTERRAGIVTFTLAGHDTAALQQQLMQAGVICAHRGGGIRFSPHFYTAAVVLERALATLQRLAPRK